MSQKKRILAHLEEGRSLNRLDSWEKLGVLEAPARISELRKAGHPIVTKLADVTNRYGEQVKVATWSMDRPKLRLITQVRPAAMVDKASMILYRGVLYTFNQLEEIYNANK